MGAGGTGVHFAGVFFFFFSLSLSISSLWSQRRGERRKEGYLRSSGTQASSLPPVFLPKYPGSTDHVQGPTSSQPYPPSLPQEPAWPVHLVLHRLGLEVCGKGCENPRVLSSGGSFLGPRRIHSIVASCTVAYPGVASSPRTV